MKNRFLRIAVPCWAVVLLACLAGCPTATLQVKFDITLMNTGVYAITGAYYASAGKDWGQNLLAAPLPAGESIVIEDLVYQNYDFRCTFDGSDQEGHPAVLELLDNFPPAQGPKCVLWEAAYSANGDWFIGYTWGCPVL